MKFHILKGRGLSAVLFMDQNNSMIGNVSLHNRFDEFEINYSQNAFYQSSSLNKVKQAFLAISKLLMQMTPNRFRNLEVCLEFSIDDFNDTYDELKIKTLLS
jgi:hypothetical protein